MESAKSNSHFNISGTFFQTPLCIYIPRYNFQNLYSIFFYLIVMLQQYFSVSLTTDLPHFKCVHGILKYS